MAEVPDLAGGAQALRDRESVQTFTELKQQYPDAAEPLESSRILALYDAAGEAQSRIGQMPPLSPIKLPEGQHDRLPPEVAVPVMALFEAFGNESAPPELAEYAVDWLPLVQTNDGLLMLTTMLRRAARDPTLLPAVLRDQEAAPLAGADSGGVLPPNEGPVDTGGGVTEDQVVEALDGGQLPIGVGQRQAQAGDTLIDIARSLGAADDTEAMEIARQIAANSPDVGPGNENTVAVGDRLSIGGLGPEFDISTHAAAIASLDSPRRAGILASIAAMEPEFLGDPGVQQRMAAAFQAYEQGDVERGDVMFGALNDATLTEPVSMLPKIRRGIESLPPEVRQHPQGRMRLQIIEALLEQGNIQAAEDQFGELWEMHHTLVRDVNPEATFTSE